MDEKEALMKWNDSYHEGKADGYLEALEKAIVLEEAIIHAKDYFQFNKKEIMYSQMKEALEKWEKIK